MMNRVWKTYNGIDVSVDESGDFCAEVNGIFLRDAVWDRLRLRIEQEMKADAKALKLELDCVALVENTDTGGEYGVQRLTLTGLNRTDATFKWGGGKLGRRTIYVLPFTQLNFNLLERLAIAKSTVREIEEGIRDRTIVESRWGGRIVASEYNNELRTLKDRYALALEAGQAE